MGRARESHAAHFIAVLRLCPEIDRANQNTRDTRSFSASSFYGCLLYTSDAADEGEGPSVRRVVLVLRVRWDSGNMLTQSRDFEDEKGALRTRAR